MEDVVKKGDFVKIEFTGRTKEDNKVFDTTDEKIAKEAGIYNENLVFKPLPVIVGEGLVIKGLDEALEGKKVGETFTIEIPPEKGFGNRDPNLMITLSEADLLKLGVKPEVGKYVRIPTPRGVFLGKIVSISGGRVVIDFNHPLAGKTLIYEVKIVEKAKTDEEKIKYIFELLFPKKSFNIKLESEKVVVECKIDDLDALTIDRLKLAKNMINKYVNGTLKLELKVNVE